MVTNCNELATTLKYFGAKWLMKKKFRALSWWAETGAFTICRKEGNFPFQESCKEDEALEPLLDAVRVLTAMLGKTEADTDKEPGIMIAQVAFLWDDPDQYQ